MDYSLLFAVEYTEEEWVNQKQQELENKLRLSGNETLDSTIDLKATTGS
jgi:hypothetical protein